MSQISNTAAIRISIIAIIVQSTIPSECLREAVERDCPHRDGHVG